MRYKLVGYTTNEKENVTFGTCEMCMSTSSMTEQFFHIQDEYGKIHKIPGFMWDWGDLDEIYINNIPKFAAWLESQDIVPPQDDYYGYDYNWLYRITDDYYEYDRLYNELLPWIDKNVHIDDNSMRISVNNSTYNIFNGFDFHAIMYQVVKQASLNVKYESYKPANNNIIEFADDTISADFSLNIDYKTKEVILRVFEYSDNNHTKYTSIEFGTAPGVLKIVFKEDNSFPDFSYEQR